MHDPRVKTVIALDRGWVLEALGGDVIGAGSVTRLALDVHRLLVHLELRLRGTLGVLRMGLRDDVLRFGGGQAAG